MAQYMTMTNTNNICNINNDTADHRRSQIEQQLKSLEKLFDDDSDAESSCSDDDSSSSLSGESMANDTNMIPEVDIRGEARAKILKLWGGSGSGSGSGSQLGGSLVVNTTSTTTAMSSSTTKEPPVEVATTTSTKIEKNEKKPRTVVSLHDDTVQTLARTTDTEQSNNGRPPKAAQQVASSRLKRSSSADDTKALRRVVVGSRSSSSATMNESFTKSRIRKFSSSDNIIKKHRTLRGDAIRSATSSTSSTMNASFTTSSSHSSSSKQRSGRGESSNKSEQRGSRKSRSESISKSCHSQKTKRDSDANNINELSRSSEHRRNRSHSTSRKRSGSRKPPSKNDSLSESRHSQMKLDDSDHSPSSKSRTSRAGGDISTSQQGTTTGLRRSQSVHGMPSSASSKSRPPGKERLGTIRRSISRTHCNSGSRSERESDATTACTDATELTVRQSNLTFIDHNGSRRVWSSCADIDRMNTRFSRRELVSSSLDAVAADTTVSSNKNAQWETVTKLKVSSLTISNLGLDRRSQLSRTNSITTRKRGGGDHADIDRLSTRSSRRELLSSGLDGVAANTTVSSNNKNAQWDNTKPQVSSQTMNSLKLDRRSQLLRTDSLTTRKRGGDLSSCSNEHGGSSSSRYRSNSRVSRSGGGLSLSKRNLYSGEDIMDMDSLLSPSQGQVRRPTMDVSQSGSGLSLSKRNLYSGEDIIMDMDSLSPSQGQVRRPSMGGSASQPRRVKSSSAEIGRMGRVPRKSSSSRGFVIQDPTVPASTKNAQWGSPGRE